MTKAKYRIKNWSSYNKSLVHRGSINLWISEEVCRDWFYCSKADRNNKKANKKSLLKSIVCSPNSSVHKASNTTAASTTNTNTTKSKRIEEKKKKKTQNFDKENLNELSFLGSPCTRDCSGHRAGYAWSQSKGGVPGTSPFSPSFNNGANLFVAGK
jgi:hypothetical protein